MKNFILQLTVLVALFFSACEPFDEPTIEGPTEPIFNMTATLNGSPISWNANGEDFKALSSHIKDSLGVHIYAGTLQSALCANEACGPRFELQIRGTEDIDSDMRKGSYPYRSNRPEAAIRDEYAVTVSPDEFESLISCTWTLDEKESFTTNGNEPLTFTRTSEDPTSVKVSLKATFDGGCTSEIENMVYLPHHGCDVEISAEEVDGPLKLTYRAVTTNKSGYDYKWQFQTGPTASSEEVFYAYDIEPPGGLDFATVTVVKDGCTATKVRNQIVKDTLPPCNVNFSYEIETTSVIPNPPGLEQDFGKIELYYVDEDGNTLINLYTQQPDWAYFEIIEAEDYRDPVVESDKRSKKVTANFAVRLSHPTKGFVDIKEGKMVIPVGLGL